MIKLFITDLDGTLLNKGKLVSKEDIHALEEARNANIDIAFASGRMDTEILKVLEIVGDKYHRISQNGAYVYTKTDEKLSGVTFERELAREVYKEVKNYRLTTLVCDHSNNFIEEKNEVSQQIDQHMFFPIIENNTLYEHIGQNLEISKITIFGKLQEIKKIQEKLDKQYRGKIDSYISDPTCLDIVPKEISKGNAISILLSKLQLDPTEVACIGDSFNDISMFHLIPFSFALKHSQPEVKKEAKYVVSSVNEAIKKVLNYNKTHNSFSFASN